MEEKQLFDTIRKLNGFLNGSSFLAAYLGLYKVRISQGRNPDECMYANASREKFLNHEKQEFKDIIKELNRILNE